MTKTTALNQLETIIGKLSNLAYHIDGSTDLQEAIRKVANVRDKLESGQNKIRKTR